MTEVAIQIDQLSRNFGSLRALNSLSFEVRRGEMFGFVGPDGAGKTTTLRVLAGILDPTSGSARVAGFDVAKESEAVKERIGYMSQRFGLYTDLTVAENIEFYADIYGVPRRDLGERIDRLLGFSNLTPFRKRLAGNLSGGMKQKLGLACALIHKPEVLLLDEPTNGVDPVSRRDFWKILYQLLREGVTVFVSTSYLDEAERCGRVALIHEGRLLALGTPTEVKRLMKGSILEIRVAETRRGTAVLRRRFGDTAIGSFGDRLHLFTGDPDRDGPEATRLLADEGFQAVSVRTIEPELEDVFVSMLGDIGAKNGGGAT